MADKQAVALMAHLIRRTGFGATRSEIEALADQGYEETVEQLLHPEDQPEFDEYTLYRYHPMAERPSNNPVWGQVNWLYRMVQTERPLQEKMALFWHHVFATGYSKLESGYEMLAQVAVFREHGMSNVRDLITRVAKNPAMIYWLDNTENHKRAPNENWGRELLELFSLGVGNYTEEDVFECARAFTGWTVDPKIHWLLWGPHLWGFEYLASDHDDDEKAFLGHKGRFNGEDVIDIIVQQPACHIFIARHLYNFFVADEPQVPAWPIDPPVDPASVRFLAELLVESRLEMKPVLRALFNSDFFKNAVYQKVKNPAEVVAGTLALTGDMNGPDPRWGAMGLEPSYMGQALLDPPSVEGWHTGKEWINSGALMQRVNFVADRVSDVSLPGVRDIIERIASSNGAEMSAEALVDHCLDLMGPVRVREETKSELVDHAESEGPIRWDTEDGRANASQRVGEVLALIAATREYQFG